MSVGQPLLRTPLYTRHEDAGARLVPFAGWEMPVQYEGVGEEHVTVRTAAGMFDVSHMGEIETKGPQAADFLQHVLSNDVTRIAVGGAQYSVLCREDGGILDDLFTYRLGDSHYLTVTNASNHEKDLAWFQDHAGGFDAEVDDAHDRWAMIAVQGPTAREAVRKVAGTDLPKRFTIAPMELVGAPAWVAGTGYTGEDGVEVLLPPDAAETLWDSLQQVGVRPTGLAARDTLRIEACFHLYGNDMDETRNPIEAGLGWACKEDTGFLGSEAVRAAREQGTAEKLVPFAFTGAGIPRAGNPIEGGGVVTSGTMSPCLSIGVGLGYVPGAQSQPGTPITVDVRGKPRAAEVRTKPLYTSTTKGS